MILVSHKSREDVLEAVKLHRDATSLIEVLIQAKRIRFKSGLGVHCSVVHKWDHREVLYRYLSPERNRISDYNMCILVGRREARPILDVVEMVKGRWAKLESINERYTPSHLHCGARRGKGWQDDVGSLH